MGRFTQTIAAAVPRQIRCGPTLTWARRQGTRLLLHPTVRAPGEPTSVQNNVGVIADGIPNACRQSPVRGGGLRATQAGAQCQSSTA